MRREDLIMETFGKGVRQRWNLGHCDDDVLIVVGVAWSMVRNEAAAPPTVSLFIIMCYVIFRFT